MLGLLPDSGGQEVASHPEDHNGMIQLPADAASPERSAVLSVPEDVTCSRTVKGGPFRMLLLRRYRAPGPV